MLRPEDGRDRADHAEAQDGGQRGEQAGELQPVDPLVPADLLLVDHDPWAHVALGRREPAELDLLQLHQQRVAGLAGQALSLPVEDLQLDRLAPRHAVVEVVGQHETDGGSLVGHPRRTRRR